MKSHPILFSAPMIRALLAGTKTQTRRIGKIQCPAYTELEVGYNKHAGKGLEAIATYRAFPNGGSARWGICSCPYGVPGDHLWVKETHLPKASGIIYQADYEPLEAAGLGGMYGGWKPSIYCRREYSRITLEITDLRAERLQDISEQDAMAEGVNWKDFAGLASKTARKLYRDLWDSINGKPITGKPDTSWKANPWVWVIGFRAVQNAEVSRGDGSATPTTQKS